MKNVITVILITICDLLLPKMAGAQMPNAHVETDLGAVNNTIVRSYGPSHAVVYYERALQGYVALVDLYTGNTKELALETRVRIKDMTIIDDTLLMGGAEYDPPPSNMCVGCIASMPMSGFFSTSDTITYLEPTYWFMNEIQHIASCRYTIPNTGRNVKKLYTAGDFYYPCNGEHYPFPYYLYFIDALFRQYYIDHSSNYCTLSGVMEVSHPCHSLPWLGDYNNPRVMTPVTYYSEEDIKHDEVISDVAVSGKYAAYVGTSRGVAEDSIVLHVCSVEKSFLFDTNEDAVLSQSRFSKYYAYPLGCFSGRDFKMYSLRSGDVAIASDSEPGSNTDGIRVRVVSLATGQMLNCFRIDRADAVLYDMAYDVDHQKLMVLFHSNDIGGNGIGFCEVDPYAVMKNTTLQAMHVLEDMKKFGSLDYHKYGYYVSTGDKCGLVTNPGMWYMTSECYQLFSVEADIISPLGRVNVNVEYDRYYMHDAGWQGVVEPIAGSVSVDCTDYPH